MASNWRKSTFSMTNGQCCNCVEAGSWRVSTRCTINECVQAGQGAGRIGIRDSALPGGPVLEVSPAAWRELVSRVKRG
jgi:hypothetical protein